MPLLDIARQRLMAESETCSKRSTFNRRQSASSERHHHHIIYYEPALLTCCGDKQGLYLFFFFSLPFFWMLSPSPKQSCIGSDSLMEHVSILPSHAPKANPSGIHCLLVCVHARVCSIVFCVGARQCVFPPCVSHAGR